MTKEYNLDYNPRENAFVVDSVNGLICFALGFTDIFIWNPSIRKKKKFSNPRPTSTRQEYRHIEGFGYDEFQDDYKIVYIFKTINSDQVVVSLYSLNMDSWKNVDGSPSEGLSNVSGKFVNGKLYSAATTAGLNAYDSGYIISFDLANEKWGKVEKPCYAEGGRIQSVRLLGSDLIAFSDYQEVMKTFGL